MNKNLVIIICIVIILFFTLIFNSHVLSQLPWSSHIGFKKNITPYIVFLVVCFACYQTINTIYLTLGLNQVKANAMNERVKGKILNIEYSSIRVGNSPRFKVTVEYNNLTKTFDALPEKVQFHLNIGDDCIIYYNPDDTQEAVFDTEASINNKESI